MVAANKNQVQGNSLEELRKNYNACIKIIAGAESFDENMKRVFTELCHDPVEQTLYDAIINGITTEELEQKDTFVSFVEKGVKLYYLHSMFNQKLGRRSYVESGRRDDCLLYCIVEEMRRRKPELDDIISASFRKGDTGQEDVRLQDVIYARYQETDLVVLGQHLCVKSKGEKITDFDQYVDYLIGLKNGLDEKRYSFHHIWNCTTGHHRSSTFHGKRPTKEELYIFCIGAAFDDSVYCRMKSLLIDEIEKGILLKGDTPKKAAKRREKYEEKEERDYVMMEYLKNINSRLIFASAEVNKIADFIPRKMLENVNEDLKKRGLEIFD